MVMYYILLNSLLETELNCKQMSKYLGTLYKTTAWLMQDLNIILQEACLQLYLLRIKDINDPQWNCRTKSKQKNRRQHENEKKRHLWDLHIKCYNPWFDVLLVSSSSVAQIGSTIWYLPKHQHLLCMGSDPLRTLLSLILFGSTDEVLLAGYPLLWRLATALSASIRGLFPCLLKKRWMPFKPYAFCWWANSNRHRRMARSLLASPAIPPPMSPSLEYH